MLEGNTSMDVKERKKLKRQLIIQSFAPLFFLLLFKLCNLEDFRTLDIFLEGFKTKNFDGSSYYILAPACCRIFTLIVSIVWVGYSFFLIRVYENFQTSNYESRGERIESIQYSTEVGLNFFVAFLIPLLIDINGLQDFFVFWGILFIVMILMWKTNLFYQNPVLIILGYKVFNFKLKNDSREYIGISRAKSIDTSKIIKKKLLTDNVYFVYNE